jgi:hypothetical protein
VAVAERLLNYPFNREVKLDLLAEIVGARIIINPVPQHLQM